MEIRFDFALAVEREAELLRLRPVRGFLEVLLASNEFDAVSAKPPFGGYSSRP